MTTFLFAPFFILPAVMVGCWIWDGFKAFMKRMESQAQEMRCD